MDEVEFHAPPRESKSKRWLSFHPFSGYGMVWYGMVCMYVYIYIYIHVCIQTYNILPATSSSRWRSHGCDTSDT